MSSHLSRRAFLARSAVIGCSAAASPLLTPVTFAAAPWDTRLVVIILRGGMDGLDVVQPYGDPELRSLRKTLSAGPRAGAKDLDGYFALHPALADLMPLWRQGDLGFAHAVSTPYRDKRSHFDGQDLLEAGTAQLENARDGWLNRMLQALPGVEQKTAFALGAGDLRVLTGAAPVADWSPEAELIMSPQAMRLAGLVMQDDPLFRDALDEALILSGQGAASALLDADSESGMDEPPGKMAGDMKMSLPQPAGRDAHVKVAQFAVEQLQADSRVVSFSLNGWDSHNNQDRTLGTALRQLSQTIQTFHTGLSPDIWGKTAILAMTEFGRTARENGTLGTDHGTGGAMVMAGGAIRGGRVHTQWPGLSEVDLYQRRDLMPTRDVRAYAGWVIRSLTGLDRTQIESRVFPGLEMGTDPGLML